MVIRVETWRDDYRYVPGLHDSDPPDLVLMYLDQQARWVWHGDPPTKFKDYGWIVVPVDFCDGIYARTRKGGWGELSERISEGEFKRRLRATLDFVRTNNRPNWKKVVAEHTAFLKTLESKGH